MTLAVAPATITAVTADPPRETHDALAAGFRLHEFEIRGVLGLGGFGIVYLAWDHALQREVALKEYMPSALAGRRGARVSVRSSSQGETFALGLKSFVNEARLLARFDHPSLVKVYRFWEDNGTAYMVMPYYKGRTLRQVRQAMAVPPAEAFCRQMLEPLLAALELLHAEDVYHRDIAPDNILIGDDGVPVLLDFGAARQVISRTQSLTAILKPNFAPLEQYADMPSMQQGPWTDVYGLGATMRYLLTGQPPLPAAARALNDEMPRLSDQGWAGCSKAFIGAIDWALALRPGDRPQSMAELREALDGLVVPAAASSAARTVVLPARLRAAAAEPARSLAFTGNFTFTDVDFDPTQPNVASGRPPPRRAVLFGAAALAGSALLATFVWLALPSPVPQESVLSVMPGASGATADAVPAPVSEPAARSNGPLTPVSGIGMAPGATTTVPGKSAVAAPPATTPARTSAGAVQTAAPAEARMAGATAAGAPPAPAQAEREAAPAPRPAAERPAPGGSPSERCAEHSFFTKPVCMKQACEQPGFREHGECRRLRADEQAQRERLSPSQQ